jgi:tetratricopeptide (TPR) repeat protein
MDSRLDQGELDELWDFSDPAASENAFRAAIEKAAPGSVARNELSTQLARSLGLQSRFDEADAVLDSIDGGSDPVVAVRIALERGRTRNSSGSPAEALALFMTAFELAVTVPDEFLAIDAAHMIAIADPERSAEWTLKALDMVAASTATRTKRWAVALHNNYGWSLFDDARFEQALTEFELAGDAATEYGTEEQRQYTREAIDEARAALSKPIEQQP